MIKGVGHGPQFPGSNNVPNGGNSIKPSKEVKESARTTTEVLDQAAEGVQGRLSRKDQLHAAGQLVRTGIGKVKQSVSDEAAGGKAVVKATGKIFAKQLKNITAFNSLKNGG